MSKQFAFVVILCCLCVATAVHVPNCENNSNCAQRDLYQDFVLWKANHGKVYESLDEEVFRFEIWHQTYNMIEEHNRGNHSYTMGLNKFSDLTVEEFKQYFGLRKYPTFPSDICVNMSAHDVKEHFLNLQLPKEVDWREKGVVNGVKDQGQCGSCWAFSAIGALESAWALSKGKLLSLSEQQLVDCSTKEGNSGCNGGLMDYAFNYTMRHGSCTSDAYPYKAIDQKCHWLRLPVATLSRCVNLNYENTNRTEVEEAMEYIVGLQQPISVAVNAGNPFWMSYSGGIIDSDDCDPLDDHGVLAIGYGTLAGKDYWLIKNSWGVDWGMKGYVMVARGKNMCGVAELSSYPIV